MVSEVNCYHTILDNFSSKWEIPEGRVMDDLTRVLDDTDPVVRIFLMHALSYKISVIFIDFMRFALYSRNRMIIVRFR